MHEHEKLWPYASYGETVHVSCEDGYEVYGEEYIRCQADGTFNVNSYPTCNSEFVYTNVSIKHDTAPKHFFSLNLIFSNMGSPCFKK